MSGRVVESVEAARVIALALSARPTGGLDMHCAHPIRSSALSLVARARQCAKPDGYDRGDRKCRHAAKPTIAPDYRRGRPTRVTTPGTHLARSRRALDGGPP